MKYIPHTPEDIQRMLEAIGIKDISQLFEAIPAEVKLKRELDLPSPLSEQELDLHMRKLANKNSDPASVASFLGGGIYRHYSPAVIGTIVSRSEFLTAYTPYQPEVSQGTLQAIFEFQTLICQLTGMEVANASMYDGAEALAESALMLLRIAKKKKRILCASSVHPEYRQTLKTYTSRLDVKVEEIPYHSQTGKIDFPALDKSLADDVAGVLVQSPNFFGVVEELKDISALCEKKGALLAVAIAEPLSLGILRPPGDYGATIVCGEAQSFGVPPSFGGPGVGFLAGRMTDVRNMPGRLCGQTVDADGNRGFVLTLAAREQHIRREKATSNICTNQALVALMVTIYLCLLGKRGLKELAKLNLSRAEYAKKAMTKNVQLKFSGETFNEFVIKVDSAEKRLSALKSEGILGGILLERWYPELKDCVLVSVTETNTKEQIDRYAKLLG